MTSEIDATVRGARAAREAGELDEWVRDFLASEGSDNEELGDQLVSTTSHWHGPVEVEFERLHRLAGPADHPTLVRLTDDDLERVDDMIDSIEDGWDPAPFIVTFEDDHLVLEDGNHRVEGLRKAGHDRYWSIIGFDSESARDRYLESH